MREEPWGNDSYAGSLGRDVADCSGCIGFAFEARARGCQRATSAAPKTVYIHTNCCTGFNVHPPEFRRKTRKWLKVEEWTGSNSSSTVWRTRVKKSTYTCLLRTHVYVVVLYLVGVLSIFVCIYIYIHTIGAFKAMYFLDSVYRVYSFRNAILSSAIRCAYVIVFK